MIGPFFSQGYFSLSVLQEKIVSRISQVITEDNNLKQNVTRQILDENFLRR